MRSELRYGVAFEYDNPLSVVFTDWLPMMAEPGVASSLAVSRAGARKSASTRPHVPPSRHF
jgi:hypothetical protein